MSKQFADALEAAAVKLDMRMEKIKRRGERVTYFVLRPKDYPFRAWVRNIRCAWRGEWEG